MNGHRQQLLLHIPSNSPMYYYGSPIIYYVHCSDRLTTKHNIAIPKSRNMFLQSNEKTEDGRKMCRDDILLMFMDLTNACYIMIKITLVVVAHQQE